jgi:hypothetical protein
MQDNSACRTFAQHTCSSQTMARRNLSRATAHLLGLEKVHPRTHAAAVTRGGTCLFAEGVVRIANLSTASRFWSGAKCAYRMVIAMLPCPRSSRTVLSGTPACTSREAKWWRKSCQRNRVGADDRSWACQLFGRGCRRVYPSSLLASGRLRGLSARQSDDGGRASEISRCWRV